MAWNDREHSECERLLQVGLEEDLDLAGDITSAAIIEPDRRGKASIVARANGVVAGLESLEILRRHFGNGLNIEILANDGPVNRGASLARFTGPMRTILAVERTILNLLCRLSGVATLTAKYVATIQGTSARVCDTRKTTPGWRYLEKYAVRVGGGTNHRIGLFDAILIKDNHLVDLAAQYDDPIREAVKISRESVPPGTIVEVEIDSLEQLASALASEPDIILLDNFTAANLSRAVEIRNRVDSRILLEASGGVHLETIRAIAETGVERISVGAITHSAPILDLALDAESVSQ